MKYKYLKNLFICSSVFQVFNTINLCGFEFGFEYSDIILVDYGTNISTYLNLNFLRSKFHSVKIVKHERIITCRNIYIDVLKKILQNKIQSTLCDIKYTNIFISGTEIYSKIYAYKYLEKLTNLYYIEDGLESYDSVLDKNSKKRQDTVFSVFFKKRPLELCKGLYLYEPNYVINNSYKKNIYRIPKVKKDTEIAGIIKDSFSGNILKIHQKAIFLEAWFNEFEKYKFQEKMLQIVVDTIGSENVGIKKHPNDICNVDLYKKYNIIEGIRSFELNNLYYTLNNKILISIISTACLTPKMIYDEEPYVVFLYRIFLSKFEYKEWIYTEKIIYKIRSRYRTPEKIMIPESLSDLKRCLNRIDIL